MFSRAGFGGVGSDLGQGCEEGRQVWTARASLVGYPGIGGVVFDFSNMLETVNTKFESSGSF
jgi:hypothetical protein